MNNLIQLRAALVARAEGHTPIAEKVAIFGTLEADADEKILAQVNRLGAALYIFQPVPVVINPNIAAQEILAEQVDIRLRIIVDLVMHQGVDPFTLIGTLLSLYHQWDPGLPNIGRLHAPERPLTQVEDPKLEIYDLLFHTTAILPTIS